MIKFEPIYTCSIDVLADEINKNIKIHSYTYIKIVLIDFMSDHNFFDRQSVWEKSINTTEKDYFDNLTDEEREYEIEMAQEYWYEEDYLWLNVDCCGMVKIPDDFIFFPEGK